jgi:hypothetical protein
MEFTRSQAEIEYAFETFKESLQKKLDEHYAKNYTNLQSPALVTISGRKYWKIVMVDTNQTFVHSFTRKEDGAIFKPASFKAPNTKGASAIRGHVCDGSNGMNATTCNGSIRYAS